MQNLYLSSFTQIHGDIYATNTPIPSKINALAQIEEAEQNPNKFKGLKLPEMSNIFAFQCQLNINCPESQENGQTVTIEEDCQQKNKFEQDLVGQCNNCIDIESIMNPNTTEKFIPYSVNNSIQIDKVDVLDQKLTHQYNSRDETKNIPKNYIKAVFSFILENPVTIKKMFTKKRHELENCELNKFLEFVRCEKKTKVYTIGRFKQIWLNQSYGKIMRIIYGYFLRKHALHYIYSSKIENKMSHVKHRGKIFKSLEEPMEFNNIK